jgi:hypothetical protein
MCGEDTRSQVPCVVKNFELIKMYVGDNTDIDMARSVSADSTDRTGLASRAGFTVVRAPGLSTCGGHCQEQAWVTTIPSYSYLL